MGDTQGVESPEECSLGVALFLRHDCDSSCNA
jgi:hypothetical protein